MQHPEMQQLRQRVIASYHLGPLDPPETQAYIEHRLRHVGWKDDPTFALEAFPIIHRLTGGVPRRINSLCNRLLLATFLSEKHAIDVVDVEAVADELNHELGPQLLPETDVVAATPKDGSQAQSSASPPKLWHVYFEQVEDRIERLERTVAAAVDLLYRLLHPDKATQGHADAGAPTNDTTATQAAPPQSAHEKSESVPRSRKEGVEDDVIPLRGSR
jgi:hypothetical protein